MAWPKASVELSELIEGAVRPFAHSKKPMFGAPTYFANDAMFTGVFGDSLFLRLPEADRREFRARYGEATTFEPVEGRAMREYVVLPPEVYRDPTTILIG